MVAFGDVKGEGVRFTGLATQWAALNCLAEGLDSPEEGRVRLEADHGGATTGVVYPSLARFFAYDVRCGGSGKDSPALSALRRRCFTATNRLRFRPMGSAVLGVTAA